MNVIIIAGYELVEVRANGGRDRGRGVSLIRMRDGEIVEARGYVMA